MVTSAVVIDGEIFCLVKLAINHTNCSLVLHATFCRNQCCQGNGKSGDEKSNDEDGGALFKKNDNNVEDGGEFSHRGRAERGSSKQGSIRRMCLRVFM